MIYCIYTDRIIEDDASNSEHIIPLSLGGANGFEIPVDKEFNAVAGTEIDGEIANDFINMFHRREHDAKGHSRKSPYPKVKKSIIEDSGKPIQVSFKKENIDIYSPMDGRNLTEDEKHGLTFKSTINIKIDCNIKFTAKVALSAGYFIYGDLFKEKVDHHELRQLMNFNRKTSKQEDFNSFNTLGWYWPHPVPEKDSKDFAMYDSFAKSLNCSFVLCIPAPKNIGFVVSVLGRLIGILNVPANTDDFPNSGDYDLGHAVLLKNKKTERISYRELAKKVLTEIENNEANE